ncbi:MAG: transcriptional regulator [Candidatus Eremiobacteraeota bacterium]|nr:transcriptional regulator [Candidatus Eremiobacteraeota bacterium]
MDELLLSKIRLSAIAELLTVDWATFGALQKTIGTTQGNLGAHLSKLVDANYVTEEKMFVDRRPQTRYRLTKKGRTAFADHVREMQAILKQGRVS